MTSLYPYFFNHQNFILAVFLKVRGRLFYLKAFKKCHNLVEELRDYAGVFCSNEMTRGII